jgi:hypothetical protein
MNTLTPQEDIFSQEEINTSNWKKLPQELRGIFDKKTMIQLIDFYNKEEIIEVGKFLMEFKADSEEEKNELLMQLPEYHAFSILLKNISQVIAEDFMQKLNKRTKKHYVYKHIKRLSSEMIIEKILPILWNDVCVPLLLKNQEFLKECLKLSNNPTRHFLLKTITELLFSDIFYKYYTEIKINILKQQPLIINGKTSATGFMLQDFFNHNQQNISKFLREPIHLSFEGLEHYNSYINDYSQNKDIFLKEGLKEYNLPASPQDLQEKNQELHLKVNELSYFRNIFFSQKTLEGVSFCIYGDEIREKGVHIEADAICSMRIMLNPKIQKIAFDDLCEYTEDIKNFYIILKSGNIDLILNRSTSELYLMGSNVCFSEIVPQKTYIQIKAIILSYIYEYLTNKEDDKVEVCCPNKDIENINNFTKEEIQKLSTYSPYESESETKEEKKEEEYLLKYNLKPLQGKKGKRVIQAIEKILGKRTNSKVGTSHFKYEGKNGGKYPISFTNKDIKAPTLKSALLWYGISQEEFLDNY